MTPEQFSETLNSWLSPGVIAGVAEDLHNNQCDKSQEAMRLHITSLAIPTAASAGLDILCGHYLSNFRVSHSALLLAKLYRPKIDDSIWREIADIRFTATVHYKFSGSAEVPINTVIQLVGSEAEIRLVQWPLHVLTDVVGQLSRYWQHVSQRANPDNIHHDHRAEWEFLAWVDMIVARAHGFQWVGSAAMTQQRYDCEVESIGRFESFRGPIPSCDQDLEMIQAIARLKNKSHHDFFDSGDEV